MMVQPVGPGRREQASDGRLAVLRSRAMDGVRSGGSTVAAGRRGFVQLARKQPTEGFVGRHLA
ncbi:MAG: hypothetical protein DWQ08_15035, partial [Proteobacteria bacterium]